VFDRLTLAVGGVKIGCALLCASLRHEFFFGVFSKSVPAGAVGILACGVYSHSIVPGGFDVTS
jgi:hypothetical protein